MTKTFGLPFPPYFDDTIFNYAQDHDNIEAASNKQMFLAKYDQEVFAFLIFNILCSNHH